MLFNSFEFIYVFLPITAMGYFLLGKYNSVVAKLWLLGASLFFYSWWNINYLPLLVASITINYTVGRQVHVSSRWSQALKKTFLIAGILFNVGLLCYYKYYDFFISISNAAMGTQFSLLNLVLPLAISFFTFQQIAYLVDSYSGKVDELNWLNYAVFVSFFPQLIVGPICHHKEIIPQFMNKENHAVNVNNVGLGISIFVAGLFKKLVIADYLAVWVDFTYNNIATVDQWVAWIGIFAYTVQIYFDFSGYSDMAIGAALIFNIHLPINFNSPLKATSLAETWRRWHITLGRFVNHYVYIPLGGSKRSSFITYRNLFISFVVVGVWHGAGWTFVSYGVAHGAAIALHRMWRDAGLKMPAWLGWFTMFSFWSLTGVLFRAPDMDTVWIFCEQLFSIEGWVPLNAVHIKQMMILSALLFIVWVMPNTMEIFDRDHTKQKRMAWQWRSNVKWGVAMGFVAIAIITNSILNTDPLREFVYYQF